MRATIDRRERGVGVGHEAARLPRDSDPHGFDDLARGGAGVSGELCVLADDARVLGDVRNRRRDQSLVLLREHALAEYLVIGRLERFRRATSQSMAPASVAG
jgi:hypothetical protein